MKTLILVLCSVLILNSCSIALSIEFQIAQDYGFIKYPNDTRSYKLNEDVTWNIQFKNKSGANLSQSFYEILILKLSLENCYQCECDSLTISNGTNKIKLCGELSNYQLRTANSSIICIRTDQASFNVSFRSDAIVVRNGFGLLYSLPEHPQNGVWANAGEAFAINDINFSELYKSCTNNFITFADSNYVLPNNKDTFSQSSDYKINATSFLIEKTLDRIGFWNNSTKNSTNSIIKQIWKVCSPNCSDLETGASGQGTIDILIKGMQLVSIDCNSSLLTISLDSKRLLFCDSLSEFKSLGYPNLCISTASRKFIVQYYSLINASSTKNGFEIEYATRTLGSRNGGLQNRSECLSGFFNESSLPFWMLNGTLPERPFMTALNQSNVLRNREGAIKYPGIENTTYSSLEYQKWFIINPNQANLERYAIIIYKLDLEYQPNCSFDKLAISFESTTFNLCGTLTNYTNTFGQRALCILTWSRTFAVLFTTDRSIHKDGFALNYSSYDPMQSHNAASNYRDLSVCGGVLYNSSVPPVFVSTTSITTATTATTTTTTATTTTAALTSTQARTSTIRYTINLNGSIIYPISGIYNNYEYRSWLVTLTDTNPNTSYDIVIYQLKLESSSTCNYDNLTISFGSTSIVLCGLLQDYVRIGQRALCIRTQMRSFTVRFRTDGSGNLEGFRLNYSASQFNDAYGRPVNITELSECGGQFYGLYRPITRSGSNFDNYDYLNRVSWSFEQNPWRFTSTRSSYCQNLQVNGDYQRGQVLLPFCAKSYATNYGTYQELLSLRQSIPESQVSISRGQTYDLLITMLDTETCCDILTISPQFGINLNFTLSGQLREYTDDIYRPSYLPSTYSLCIATESSSFSINFRSDGSVSGRGFELNYTLRSSWNSSFGFPRELQTLCGNKFYTSSSWLGRLSTTITTTTPRPSTPYLHNYCNSYSNLDTQRGRIEYPQVYTYGYGYSDDYSLGYHRGYPYRPIYRPATPPRYSENLNCQWSFYPINYYSSFYYSSYSITTTRSPENEEYRVFVITKLDLEYEDHCRDDYLTIKSSPTRYGYQTQNGTRVVLCGRLEDYLQRGASGQTALCIRVPGSHSGEIQLRSDHTVGHYTGIALSYFNSNLTDPFDNENYNKCGGIFYTAHNPPVSSRTSSHVTQPAPVGIFTVAKPTARPVSVVEYGPHFICALNTSMVCGRNAECFTAPGTNKYICYCLIGFTGNPAYGYGCDPMDDKNTLTFAAAIRLPILVPDPYVNALQNRSSAAYVDAANYAFNIARQITSNSTQLIVNRILSMSKAQEDQMQIDFLVTHPGIISKSENLTYWTTKVKLWVKNVWARRCQSSNQTLWAFGTSFNCTNALIDVEEFSECEQFPGLCAPNSNCMNTDLSFACKCVPEAENLGVRSPFSNRDLCVKPFDENAFFTYLRAPSYKQHAKYAADSTEDSGDQYVSPWTHDAICHVGEQHVHVCECEPGYVGDPYTTLGCVPIEDPYQYLYVLIEEDVPVTPLATLDPEHWYSYDYMTNRRSSVSRMEALLDYSESYVPQSLNFIEFERMDKRTKVHYSALFQKSLIKAPNANSKKSQLKILENQILANRIEISATSKTFGFLDMDINFNNLKLIYTVSAKDMCEFEEKSILSFCPPNSTCYPFSNGGYQCLNELGQVVDMSSLTWDRANGEYSLPGNEPGKAMAPYKLPALLFGGLVLFFVLVLIIVFFVRNHCRHRCPSILNVSHFFQRFIGRGVERARFSRMHPANSESSIADIGREALETQNALEMVATPGDMGSVQVFGTDVTSDNASLIKNEASSPSTSK